MVWITAFFTDDGDPKSGLSPTIDIWEVDTNNQVITDGVMTEIGTSAIYKYDFSGYDPDKLYVFLADGGSGLPRAERYKDNSSSDANISPVSSIVDGVWDEQLSEHLISGSAGSKLDTVSVGGVDYDSLRDAVWYAPIPSTPSSDSAAAFLRRIAGLVHENHYIDETSYQNGLLTSGRIRIYNDPAKVGTDNGVIGIYRITALYHGDGTLDTYKVVKE